ncbi:hypothetical protein K438DRAFT_1881097 [Mycena galopus ATCC 62051]|nr:hypothetical protein K438DRAFT_1881097 [Mycena galopus ATCC 62051]
MLSISLLSFFTRQMRHGAWVGRRSRIIGAVRVGRRMEGRGRVRAGMVGEEAMYSPCTCPPRQKPPSQPPRALPLPLSRSLQPYRHLSVLPPLHRHQANSHPCLRVLRVQTAVARRTPNQATWGSRSRSRSRSTCRRSCPLHPRATAHRPRPRAMHPRLPNFPVSATLRIRIRRRWPVTRNICCISQSLPSLPTRITPGHWGC